MGLSVHFTQPPIYSTTTAPTSTTSKLFATTTSLTTTTLITTSLATTTNKPAVKDHVLMLTTKSGWNNVSMVIGFGGESF